MKHIVNVCGAAMLAAALATPAAAQVAGTYNGTSADGSGLQFVVGTDSSNGELAVTSATVFFTAPCKKSTYVLNTGWGFGLTADITKGKVTYTVPDNYFVITFSLDFSKDGQSATGTILSVSPTLAPVSDKPKTALICTSPKQSLSVTLQTDASASATRSAGPMQLDPAAKPVAQIFR
jgi:hypothetical protein